MKVKYVISGDSQEAIAWALETGDFSKVSFRPADVIAKEHPPTRKSGTLSESANALDEEQIEQILDLLVRRVSKRKVAKQYGISISDLRLIVSNLPDEKYSEKRCRGEGCGQVVYVNRLCITHYRAWAKLGRPADWEPSKIDSQPDIWTDTERRCSSCGQFKPFSEFHKNRRGTNGINNRCKECMKLVQPAANERGVSVEKIQEYLASDKHKSTLANFNGRLDTPCHVWLASSEGGYGQKVLLGHLYRVPRLVLIGKLGRYIKPNMTASHLCHNRACCNPDHIEEETMPDNIRRGSYKSNGYPYEHVEEIKSAALEGLTPKMIARKYDTTAYYVKKVLNS